MKERIDTGRQDKDTTSLRRENICRELMNNNSHEIISNAITRELSGREREIKINLTHLTILNDSK